MTPDRLAELRALAARLPKFSDDLRAIEAISSHLREMGESMTIDDCARFGAARTAYMLAFRASRLIAEYEGKGKRCG